MAFTHQSRVIQSPHHEGVPTRTTASKAIAVAFMWPLCIAAVPDRSRAAAAAGRCVAVADAAASACAISLGDAPFGADPETEPRDAGDTAHEAFASGPAADLGGIGIGSTPAEPAPRVLRAWRCDGRVTGMLAACPSVSGQRGSRTQEARDPPQAPHRADASPLAGPSGRCR